MQGTKGAKSMMAEILQEHPEYHYVGQHQNLANPRGHYVTTGPEIWRDTCGQVDIFVAPLGTGGTLCGTGRFLKMKKPSVELIAVEPAEAPFVKEGRWAPHRMVSETESSSSQMDRFLGLAIVYSSSTVVL
jgi:cysteine synthase A